MSWVQSLRSQRECVLLRVSHVEAYLSLIGEGIHNRLRFLHFAETYSLLMCGEGFPSWLGQVP